METLLSTPSTTSISQYLQVPDDECRNLSSPPCSPVPVNWHDSKEDPPVPWLEDFDLDSNTGMVHLGNGQFSDLSKSTENQQFHIIRRGIIISENSPINTRQSSEAFDLDDDQLKDTTLSNLTTTLPVSLTNVYKKNKGSSSVNRKREQGVKKVVASPTPSPHPSLSTISLPLIIVDSYE